MASNASPKSLWVAHAAWTSACATETSGRAKPLQEEAPSTMRRVCCSMSTLWSVCPLSVKLSSDGFVVPVVQAAAAALGMVASEGNHEGAAAFVFEYTELEMTARLRKEEDSDDMDEIVCGRCGDDCSPTDNIEVYGRREAEEGARQGQVSAGGEHVSARVF